ncbi:MULTISPECIES: putative bifunctional diguanylate cyclase/phosphodiesterase [Pseudoalteromonas]|uniref:Diguanylate cyclase n=1 Tax=Pseudoalteromonas amylolytica TaxID=1859457 RepID=A0A1S1MPZ2_9GAMM|nr:MULTISPECIES: EAL domain-containing protein [Pseudoalteromonas]OHU84373.1 diguanylate cyclase [Pseudoalteromonas sp. JW3]OHU87088.1 diguanylate cyclase [Pseudoalteromonas amylolytica]
MNLSISQFYSLQSSAQRYQFVLDMLNHHLNSTHCFIGKFINGGTQVKTLRYLHNGKRVDNFVYDLSDTPCKDAKCSQEVCTFEYDLQQRYPKDTLLQTLNINSYIGLTLRAPDHQPVGILVCMFEHPQAFSEQEKAYFSELGHIVATELSHHQEMNAKERLLKQLATGERIAKLSSWTWYIKQNIHCFSHEMHNLLNTQTEQVSLERFLACLQGSDQQRLLEQMEQISNEEIDSFELVVTHKSENQSDGLFHIVAVLEASDHQQLEPVMRATVQDITYTWALNKQLELTNVVFENASEAFMITDRHNKIMMVNKAFEAQTGYSANELYGEDPSILSSGKQNKKFYQKMWQQLEQTGVWKGEIYNRRKDGQVFPEELTLNAVKGEDGEITNYVAIFRDITEWKRNEAQLTFYANHETLTGLLNRRSFMQTLEKSVQQHKSQQGGLSLLFIGLDRFKEINDIFGPEVGDQVLIAVADRLQSTLKRKDMAGRYGGDEFVLLLHNQSQHDMMASAEHLKHVISEPYVFDELTIELSASIGVAHALADENINGTVLVRNAAHALSTAKKQGRGRVALHNEAIQNAYISKIKLKDKLKHALKHELLSVHYQPVVDVKSGQTAKFEALVRWHDEELGFISPARFIPIAEEFGLIHLVGQYVLQTSCRDLAMLHRSGFEHIGFSINRSINEFKASNNQLVHISDAIQEFALPFECITIEVTESMAANSYTWQVLQALSAKGIKVALDDFCTGYSSLSNLIDNPIDYVKIDKSFVDSMVEDTSKQVMIKCLIDLSSQLGIGVIAEGVEHRQQQSMLAEFGCHLIQGYFYSQAMPIAKCLAMLEREEQVNSKLA